jgi:hypothetical protein
MSVTRPIRRIGVTIAALLVFATPALAGPPWVSIEYPTNPHDPSTRGAIALVHAYHHSDHITPEMSATAEAFINGRRASVPLKLTPTGRAGVYAVSGELEGDGPWLVVVTLEQAPTATATALVAVNSDGRITSVRVPIDTNHEGWVIPRKVTEQDIEAELRETIRVTQVSAAATPQPLSLAGLIPFGGLLAVIGIAGRLRTRRED